MFIRSKYHKILLFFFLILYSCQLQDPNNNHGILFLENRSAKLIIDVTNKNDVIKNIGYPHSKSINNDNEWIFIERTLTKGEFHKLGRNIIKENNILILKFNKYGILKDKKFLTKEDIKKLAFSDNETTNELSQKSLVQKFLNSLRDKMYKKR